MWYHISKDAGLTDITELREPKQETSQYEARDKRLCVAPSVWQCLLSTNSKDEDVFVYKVDVEDPVDAAGKVADSLQTEEA